MTTVAFIGLGVMGYPMAGHLAAKGYTVRVYNRSFEKAKAWAAQHTGAAFETPALAAQGADFVMVCVGNDDDVRSVTTAPNGAIEGMKAGATLVDHTTASQTLALELASACAAKGLKFIDAPVSGGQAGAEKGQLTVMCGASQADFDAAQAVMQSYGKAVTLMGAVGSGQLTKMVNQICIAGLVQALSEAIAFGEKAGLDMNLVLSAISKGAAQSWQMENRGPTMIQRHFDYGFAVDWMRKDMGLVLDQAKKINANLPISETIKGYYDDLSANYGAARQDTSSLIKRLV